MSEVAEKLLLNRDKSESKSYLVGLERGRIWAEDYADYFDMMGWKEMNPDEFVNLKLPREEEMYFRMISMESHLDLNSYIRGWIMGVKEIIRRY